MNTKLSTQVVALTNRLEANDLELLKSQKDVKYLKDTTVGQDAITALETINE